jgi:hypothetical protein
MMTARSALEVTGTEKYGVASIWDAEMHQHQDFPGSGLSRFHALPLDLHPLLEQGNMFFAGHAAPPVAEMEFIVAEVMCGNGRLSQHH